MSLWCLFASYKIKYLKITNFWPLWHPCGDMISYQWAWLSLCLINTPSLSQTGMVGLTPKWVRLALNGTNPRLFQIRFSSFWFGSKWNKSISVLVHFGFPKSQMWSLALDLADLSPPEGKVLVNISCTCDTPVTPVNVSRPCGET